MDQDGRHVPIHTGCFLDASSKGKAVSISIMGEVAAKELPKIFLYR